MFNKTFILVFITLFSSATIMAQHHYGADTMAIYSQLNKKNTLAFKSLTLKDSTQTNYGIVTLSHNYQTGNFRKAQEAYNSNNTTFYTEGYQKLGKFWLAGNFSFNKMNQDSLANSLKRSDDDINPYYYFAAKSGRYEIQNYNANTVIDYSLIPNKLNIGTKINYESHWTTRSVDPRINIKDFKLVLSPEIAYTINTNHKIGMGFSWGYGFEQTTVSFKNSTYLQSLAYPDRIHYINQGYGYISIKDSTSLKRFNDFNGAELNYQFQKNKLDIKLHAAYSKKTQENTVNVTSIKKYFVREKFTLNTLDLQLLLTKADISKTQQIDINALIRDGYDWNAAFLKQNYTAQDYYINAGYSLLWNKQKSTNHQAEINVLYESVLRSDAASAHQLNTQSFQPELTYTLNHKQSNTDTWLISLGAFYKKPLSTEVSVPTTQINTFTTGVTFPDYYYYGSTTFGIKNQINYISNNLFENFKIGFSLKTNYRIANNTPEYIYNAQFLPKGSRLNVLAAINIYL